MNTSRRSCALLLLVTLVACNSGGATVVARDNRGLTAVVRGDQHDSFLAVSTDTGWKAARAGRSDSTSAVVAIDAGGGVQGKWVADSDYSGGWVATESKPVDTSLIVDPAPAAVYESQRTGTSFAYSLPGFIANAAYTVRLHFVESFFTSSAKRVFDVTLNKKQVLTKFDIYQNAGGSNIAITRSFPVNADGSGKIMVAFRATLDNASLAAIDVSTGSASPAPTPTATAEPRIMISSCAPTAADPVFAGCFTGNSPYRHTVASLLAAGATAHRDSTAEHYWANGNPLTGNHIESGATYSSSLWISSSGDPTYSVSCPAYGVCDAATSVTGFKVHIPRGAAPTQDTDHHIYVFDRSSAQEIDMWGGFSAKQACQIGSIVAGVLTCSWGGGFPLSGNGLATVAGDSGIAGGAAYGIVAITAGEILSGHVLHALGLIGPCLDSGGHYPSAPGRSSDSTCSGNASGGGNGAEPTLRYGDMLHLKASVDLHAEPYASYSQYCRVVITALQQYGAYAEDNSSTYGLRLMAVDQQSPGWQTIMSSVIAGGDASGTRTAAIWYSCLNRIRAADLETITLNQGNGTIAGGNASLPPITSP